MSVTASEFFDTVYSMVRKNGLDCDLQCPPFLSYKKGIISFMVDESEVPVIKVIYNKRFFRRQVSIMQTNGLNIIFPSEELFSFCKQLAINKVYEDAGIVHEKLQAVSDEKARLLQISGELRDISDKLLNCT